MTALVHEPFKQTRAPEIAPAHSISRPSQFPMQLTVLWLQVQGLYANG